MSVTGEVRVSEIKSLNIQVSATGKTKIQQPLPGRECLKTAAGDTPFFCCCFFTGGWVGTCLYDFSSTTRPPSWTTRDTAQGHWCYLCSCECSQTDTQLICLDLCVYTCMCCPSVPKCQCLIGICGQSCCPWLHTGTQLQQPPNSILPNEIFQVRWTNPHPSLHTSPLTIKKKNSQLQKNRPYWEDACLPTPFHTLWLRFLSSAPTPALCTQAMEVLAGCPPQGWLWWSAGGPAQPRLRHLAGPPGREQLGSSQACSALLALPLPSPFGNTAFLASTLARRLCAHCWPSITSSINRGFISTGIF